MICEPEHMEQYMKRSTHDLIIDIIGFVGFVCLIWTVLASYIYFTQQ